MIFFHKKAIKRKNLVSVPTCFGWKTLRLIRHSSRGGFSPTEVALCLAVAAAAVPHDLRPSGGPGWIVVVVVLLQRSVERTAASTVGADRSEKTPF